MAGNDLHVRRKLRDDLFDGINHAVNTAAAVDINEGKAVGHEVVAHVNHVRLGKKDDGVAIGVARGKEESTNVFAVQMNGHVVIEGDDGQRLLGCGLHLPVN